MIVDKIIDFEEGNLTDDEVIELFQELVDTGMINQLQGFYQRTARDLWEAGYITLPSMKGEQTNA
jgi:hypothetical protein